MTVSDCVRQGDDCEWLLWGRVRYAHPPQQSLLGAQPPHTRTDGQTDRQTHRQPGLPGLRARAQSPVSITLGAPPTRNPPGSWANCHPVGVGERSGRELGCRHGDDGLGAPPRLPVSHRGSGPRPLSAQGFRRPGLCPRGRLWIRGAPVWAVGSTSWPRWAWGTHGVSVSVRPGPAVPGTHCAT